MYATDQLTKNWVVANLPEGRSVVADFRCDWIGLGVAILIDVLIVRMIVSPALMTLLGDRAWWIPAWLDRILPRIHFAH